jgi:hypothetical protein
VSVNHLRRDILKLSDFVHQAEDYARYIPVVTFREGSQTVHQSRVLARQAGWFQALLAKEVIALICEVIANRPFGLEQ